ncbi:hypothetical protein HK405_004011 [Cladochytrium tenue]|nr:hypothetical protein HK405_004011 [Cladochytrium tenue]
MATMPNSHTSAAAPHILIIGAGISGLCLAQGLKRRGVPFSVFERDPAADHRAQGYRLRINADGYDGLEGCLPAAVMDLYSASLAKTVFNFRHFQAVTGMRDTSVPPPPHRSRDDAAAHKMGTADRLLLRTVLLSGIEDHVHFDKELASVDVAETPGSRRVVTARFRDGSSASGDLLVAADGAHSRVRKLLAPDLPILDTDGRAVYGKTTLTPAVRAAVNPALLDGGAVVLFQKDLPPNNHCVSMFLESITFPTPVHTLATPHGSRTTLPETSDYIYWVLIGRSDVITGAADTPLPAAGADSHALARTVTAAWHPSLRALLDSMSATDVAGCSATRVSTVPPEILPWTRTTGGVTLIGDACHAMSPTAGSGANAALDDCARLADLVAGIAAESTWYSAGTAAGTAGAPQVGDLDLLAGFEKGVRERAGKCVALSRMGGVKLYNQPPFEECRVEASF